MPTPSDAGRRALKLALGIWHRDTCYPTASEGELEIGADAILAALRADPDRAAGEREAAERMRHYARRAVGSGALEIVDREFDFVRCVLPYDYRWTCNAQQHQEAAAICRALEGSMESIGVVTVVLPLDPTAGQEKRQGEGDGR